MSLLKASSSSHHSRKKKKKKKKDSNNSFSCNGAFLNFIFIAHFSQNETRLVHKRLHLRIVSSSAGQPPASAHASVQIAGPGSKIRSMFVHNDLFATFHGPRVHGQFLTVEIFLTATSTLRSNGDMDPWGQVSSVPPTCLCPLYTTLDHIYQSHCNIYVSSVYFDIIWVEPASLSYFEIVVPKDPRRSPLPLRQRL
jgi:hypothetical protein